MDFTQFIQILSVATNLSIVVVGVKLIRHLARMEFKVELMWISFAKTFGIKQEIKEQD